MALRSRVSLAPSRITRWDQQIILVCQEGFQPSLAAAALHQLGLNNATDLDGGCLRDPESRGRPGATRHERPLPLIIDPCPDK
jgi:hypothetical protein